MGIKELECTQAPESKRGSFCCGTSSQPPDSVTRGKHEQRMWGKTEEGHGPRRKCTASFSSVCLSVLPLILDRGTVRERSGRRAKGDGKPVRQGTVQIIRMVSLTALRFNFHGVVYI